MFLVGILKTQESFMLFSVFSFLLFSVLFVEKYNLSTMVTIKSYSYSKLVLAYGRERGATVTVQWNSSSNAFTLVFGNIT